MSELFQTIVFWCKRLTLENIKRLLYNGSSFANGGSWCLIIGISSNALYHIFGQTISFQVLDCLHDYPWHQAAISWRASEDRQISLSASAERAFANFYDKKTSYFTMANFCNKNNDWQPRTSIMSLALALTAL